MTQDYVNTETGIDKEQPKTDKQPTNPWLQHDDTLQLTWDNSTLNTATPAKATKKFSSAVSTAKTLHSLLYSLACRAELSPSRAEVHSIKKFLKNLKKVRIFFCASSPIFVDFYIGHRKRDNAKTQRQQEDS